MNKHKIVSNLAIAVFSLALGSSLLINHNLEKHFSGDFIHEENAYFCEEITNKTDFIKAHKFLMSSQAFLQPIIKLFQSLEL